MKTHIMQLERILGDNELIEHCLKRKNGAYHYAPFKNQLTMIQFTDYYVIKIEFTHN